MQARSLSKPSGKFVALANAGVNIGDPATTTLPDGPLAGKIVVPTGVFARYSRDGIKDVIRQAGGRPTSSVSKKTDLLVVGEEPGAKKLAAAREYGVTTVNEAQFVALLNTDDAPVAAVSAE